MNKIKVIWYGVVFPLFFTLIFCWNFAKDVAEDEGLSTSFVFAVILHGVMQITKKILNLEWK